MEEYTDYSFCRNLMSYDERILWTGRPEVKNVFSAVPLSSYVVSLIWTVVCIVMFKLIRSTATNVEQFFLVIWVIFIGIGIYGFAVWPFQSYYQQKKTVYVITNRKVYRQRGQNVKSLSVSDMNGYSTSYRKNGTGTISFPITTMVPGARRPYISEFKLENLPDTEHALQAISGMDRPK